MSGTDIFIAIMCAVMLFGGMYLNIRSRKMADQYLEAHRPDMATPRNNLQKPVKK